MRIRGYTRTSAILSSMAITLRKDLPRAEVLRYASAADVSEDVMRAVLAGQPTLSRARCRALAYLSRANLLRLITKSEVTS